MVIVTRGITKIPTMKSERDNIRSKKLLGVRMRVQRLNGIMTRRFEANIEEDNTIDTIETTTIPPIFGPSSGISGVLGSSVGFR